MTVTSEIDIRSPWDTFIEEIRVEGEQSARALKEISLMLEQSQAELNKLAQRNTTITAHLQQVQTQFETLPRADIRMAYDAALDAQHRLFVMRGQLEKLQTDQAHLQKMVTLIERTQKLTVSDKTEIVQPFTADIDSDLEMAEMVTNAQEDERKKLSRQMHDGPAQALSNFILQTEIALRLFDVDSARAREELTNLKTAAMATFQKVRNYIFELRPMSIDDLGVVPTMKRYAESIKESSGIDTTLAVTGNPKRIEPFKEILIFRAFQEILGNALRHSQATQIRGIVNMEDSFIRVSVEDNGKGFSPQLLNDGQGMGLRQIKERVTMLGGELVVDTAPGQGSRISFEVPYERTRVI